MGLKVRFALGRFRGSEVQFLALAQELAGPVLKTVGYLARMARHMVGNWTANKSERPTIDNVIDRGAYLSAGMAELNASVQELPILKRLPGILTAGVEDALIPSLTAMFLGRLPAKDKQRLIIEFNIRIPKNHKKPHSVAVSLRLKRKLILSPAKLHTKKMHNMRAIKLFFKSLPFGVGVVVTRALWVDLTGFHMLATCPKSPYGPLANAERSAMDYAGQLQSADSSDRSFTFDSFAEFLHAAKTGLDVLRFVVGSPLHVVIGNEAGDLDSLVSALVIAYLQSVKTNGTSIALPVFNVPRAELRLRKDNVRVLQKAGINESDIICRDEIPLDRLANEGRLALTLVDHNELSPLQQSLAGSVVAVIDHHRDAGLYNETVSASSRRVVFPVGSCCTLVANELLEAGGDGMLLLQDRLVNSLLTSVIVIDTNALKDNVTTTAADENALTQLKKFLGDQPALWDLYSDL